MFQDLYPRQSQKTWDASKQRQHQITSSGKWNKLRKEKRKDRTVCSSCDTKKISLKNGPKTGLPGRKARKDKIGGVKNEKKASCQTLSRKKDY